MKNKGFGHLKTRLFTIKTSKKSRFGGPMVGCVFFDVFLKETFYGFFLRKIQTIFSVKIPHAGISCEAIKRT